MFRDDGCERPGRDVQGCGFRPGRACAGHRGDHGLGSKSRLVPGTAAAAAAPARGRPCPRPAAHGSLRRGRFPSGRLRGRARSRPDRQRDAGRGRPALRQSARHDRDRRRWPFRGPAHRPGPGIAGRHRQLPGVAGPRSGRPGDRRRAGRHGWRGHPGRARAEGRGRAGAGRMRAGEPCPQRRRGRTGRCRPSRGRGPGPPRVADRTGCAGPQQDRGTGQRGHSGRRHGRGAERDRRAAVPEDRPRLPRLQARHLPAPRPAPDAGAADRRAARLYRTAPHLRRRGAEPVQRSSDRRDRILPRRKGMGHPRTGRDPAPVQGQAPARAAAGLGRRLLDRRGSLFPGDPAGRTSRQGGRATPDPDLRFGPGRAGAGGGAGRPIFRQHRQADDARAAGAMVRQGRRHLLRGQGTARDVHLLPAQPDQGRALLAARPRFLPEPADLPGRGTAGKGDPAVPLCPAPRRLPVLG